MRIRTWLPILLAATLAFVLFAAACGHGGHVRTRITVGVGFFYDHLATWGDWLWVDAYGWVWTPWDVGPAWRPYTQGRWVLTGDGWTWVSSWPWGWAPFHYGRWTHHDVHGWIWIPGTDWAPAWVAWRHGGGFVGWAPLPPRAHWAPGNGLHWDGDGIGVHAWSFVGQRDFLRLELQRSLQSAERNAEHLHATADATRYENGPGGPIAGGVPLSEIERAVGPVERLRIRELERPPAPDRGRVDQRDVRVYRPQVTPAPQGQKPPAAKRRPTRHGHG